MRFSDFKDLYPASFYALPKQKVFLRAKSPHKSQQKEEPKESF